MLEKINLGERPDGSDGDTFESACTKINNNFKKLSEEAKPIILNGESSAQERILHIYDVIKYNSELLGFNYPDLRQVVNQQGTIKPRAVFEPIVDYFNRI
ncbi:hypothetical protein [Acinetobacter guerrae]|uniref:hypothetical protein n=1 Tax=Acinetobacter guerrae TaxID=1843371 RepID=UPI00125F9B15|nr:hypothetical protein [Acinetobacter guerrae]